MTYTDVAPHRPTLTTSRKAFHRGMKMMPKETRKALEPWCSTFLARLSCRRMRKSRIKMPSSTRARPTAHKIITVSLPSLDSDDFMLSGTESGTSMTDARLRLSCNRGAGVRAERSRGWGGRWNAQDGNEGGKTDDAGDDKAVDDAGWQQDNKEEP